MNLNKCELCERDVSGLETFSPKLIKWIDERVEWNERARLEYLAGTPLSSSELPQGDFTGITELTEDNKLAKRPIKIILSPDPYEDETTIMWVCTYCFLVGSPPLDF